MKQKVTDAIRIHKELLSYFETSCTDTVTKAAEMITASFKNGGCLYLCGNGGSAADCQHIAGEFIGRFRLERKALPAVAISTDSSVLTCIGNDYCFKNVFARQVEALVKKNDVLWAFSTSGSSGNVVSAANLAKEKGAKVIAFTGKSGSILEQISDLCLCIDSVYTSSAQEIHQLAYHIICDIVESSMFGSKA